MLFRVESLDSLRYRVPNLLDSAGITDTALVRALSDDDLRALIDEYHDNVQLGNNLGIVWVTDFVIAADLLADLPLLIRRLGIEGFPDDRCVVCSYDRPSPPITLHVPRSLDGISNPRFVVQTDCTADHGTTKPLDDTLDGLPEAVHRMCAVRPDLWAFRRLN